MRPWARAAGDLAGAVAEAVERERRAEGRLAVLAPRPPHAGPAAVLPGALIRATRSLGVVHTADALPAGLAGLSRAPLRR